MTGPQARAGQSELVDDIIAQFRAAFGELRCIGSQRLRQHGLSAGHLHVASMLERHGGMPMSRIADVLDVSLSAATGVVDRMEERGIVERARLADDRRVVFVQLTDRGRQLLDDVEVLRSEMLRSILERLGPDRLAALAATLGDLRAAVDAAAQDQPSLFAHNHPHDRASHARPVHHTAEGIA